MAILSSRLMLSALCGGLAFATSAGLARHAEAQIRNQWQQLKVQPQPVVVQKRPAQQVQRQRVPVPRREVVQRPEQRQPTVRQTPVERTVPKKVDPPTRVVTPTPKSPPVVNNTQPPQNVPKSPQIVGPAQNARTVPPPVTSPSKPAIVTAPVPKTSPTPLPSSAARQIETLRQQRIDGQRQQTLQRTPVLTQPLQAKPALPGFMPKKPSTDQAAIAANRIQAARQQRIVAAKNLPAGVNKLSSPIAKPALVPSPSANPNPTRVLKPLQTQPGQKGIAVGFTTSPGAPSSGLKGAGVPLGAATKAGAAQQLPGGGIAANSLLNRKLISGAVANQQYLPPYKNGISNKFKIGPQQYPQAYSYYNSLLPPWVYKAKIPYWTGGFWLIQEIIKIPGGGYSVTYESDDGYAEQVKSGKTGIHLYPESSGSGSAVSPVTTAPEPPASPPTGGYGSGGGTGGGTGGGSGGGGGAVAPAIAPDSTPPGGGSGSNAAPPPSPPEPARIINVSSTATAGAWGGSVFEACAPDPRRSEADAATAPPSAAAPPGDGDPAPAQLVVENGGHLAQIRSILFTPGGKCLISAGDDKTIRIWSLATGRSERVLRGEIEVGPKGVVQALALSPDGATLAAGGSMDVPEQGGHAIRLYDLRTGEITALLIGHTDEVRALAFSPDGSMLLSGGLDRQAVLWDVAQRAPLQLFSGHDGAVVDVAFTPDGQRVVTASHDRTGRLWDVADGHEIARLKGHEGPLTALAVLGTDGLLLTASQDGDLKLWSGGDGRFVRSAGHVDFVPGAVVPAADGSVIVVTCAERCRRNFEQRVIRVADGRSIISYRGHDGFVAAAAINGEGLVATGGGNGHEIHLWKLAEAKTEQVLKGTGRSVSATGFFPDSQTFAWSYSFSERSHQVRGVMEFSIDLPGDNIRLGQPTVVEADAASGFVHSEIQAGDNLLEHAASADGNAGAGRGAGAGMGSGGGNTTGSGAAVIRIRQSGRVVASVDPAERLGRNFAYRTYGFLPSNIYFAAGGDSGVLEAYDLNGTVMMNYVGHTSTVWSLTPSPDGRFMVSGGGDQTVKLWNASTGELIVTLFHGRDNEWVMWTPQGYYTGSANGGALIGWHVNRGDANAAEFVRGQQLRQYLNRPDIVERAITKVSATEAIQELAPNHVNIEELLTQGRPPVVVYFDGEREASGGRSVVIVGVRENEMPVESFDIWVRDRKVSATKVELPAKFKREPGIDYTALEIPLYSGENDVRVVANNEIGSSDASDKGFAIGIRHNGEGALDRRGTLHILAVGVDKYPGLPKKCTGADGSCDLLYAGRDAVTFAQTAASEMKQAHERVASRVLVTGRGAADEPTRANIIAALGDLKNSVKENDTVALFFAGHGDNVGGGYYFLPTDVGGIKGHEPGDNFLAWSEVQQTVYPVPGRKMLFLDACRSGNAYYQQLGEEATVSRFTAFTASTGQQFAEEDGEIQHGQFTYAVVNGLKGKARDERSRAVMVLGLANYVTVEVAARTRGRQTPLYYITPGDGNFPIVKY